MTKQEIKKAIENGENVWYPQKRTIKQIDLKNTHPIFNGYQIDIMIEDENGWHTEFYGIKDLYKTKAEAEHYLHHANITRTEHLPFLTWEEFKEGKELRFYNGKYMYKMNWSVDPEIIVIKRYLDFDIDEFIFNERLTEDNFYKAYDECVRLFRMEEV